MADKNAKNPSSMFFWNDLENDEKLRACSLAAKGLWACHLLPMAKRSALPGVVIVGEHTSRWDRDLPALLARLVGEPAEIVAALLAELVKSEAASIDNMGRIYNRRMVREAELSAERSRAGRQGALATNASRQKSGKRVGKPDGKEVGNDLGKEAGKPVGNQPGKTSATESEESADGISIIRDGAAAEVRQNSGKPIGNDFGNMDGKEVGKPLGKSSPSSFLREDSMREEPLQGSSPDELQIQTPSPVAARGSAVGAPHTTAMGMPKMAERLAALVEERRKATVVS